MCCALADCSVFCFIRPKFQLITTPPNTLSGIMRREFTGQVVAISTDCASFVDDRSTAAVGDCPKTFFTVRTLKFCDLSLKTVGHVDSEIEVFPLS